MHELVLTHLRELVLTHARELILTHAHELILTHAHELILTHAHKLVCVCVSIILVPWCYSLILRAYDATNQNICKDFQQKFITK